MAAASPTSQTLLNKHFTNAMDSCFQTVIGALKHEPEILGERLMACVGAIAERSLRTGSPQQLSFSPRMSFTFQMTYGLSLDINKIFGYLELEPRDLAIQYLNYVESLNVMNQLMKMPLDCDYAQQHTLPETATRFFQEVNSAAPSMEKAVATVGADGAIKNIFLHLDLIASAAENGLYDEAPQDGNYVKQRETYIRDCPEMANIVAQQWNLNKKSLFSERESPFNSLLEKSHSLMGLNSNELIINQGRIEEQLRDLAQEERTSGAIHWTTEKVQAYQRAILEQQAGASHSPAAAASQPLLSAPEALSLLQNPSAALSRT